MESNQLEMPLRVRDEPSVAQILISSHERFLGSIDGAKNEWVVRKEVLELCFRNIDG